MKLSNAYNAMYRNSCSRHESARIISYYTFYAFITVTIDNDSSFNDIFHFPKWELFLRSQASNTLSILKSSNKDFRSTSTSRNGLTVAKAGHKSEGHIGMMADKHDV